MTLPAVDIDPFYRRVLRTLLRQGLLQPQHALLVVAGGAQDKAVLQELGFTNVTITNLDTRLNAADYTPYTWEYQDCEALTYADEQFDFTLVHWGLHHCFSPHTGLLQMYRVSRLGLILFEPHDNFLTRLGARFQFGQTYETEAVFYNQCAHGGVKNSAIPNYVYRFDRREIVKTVAANAPYARHHFQFYYDLAPGTSVQHQRNPLRRYLLTLALPVLRLATALAPPLCNRFAAVVLRPDLKRDLYPWLRLENEIMSVNSAYLRQLYQDSADL